MWMMTKRGFISVVAFDPTKDKEKRSKREIKSWGKHPMLVRARLKGDIEQIRPFWRRLRVYEDKSADYAVRAIVPGSRLAEFFYFQVWEITYNSHFKEVAEANSPGGIDEGKRRHSAYMRCWNALADLQATKPYSGSYYGSDGWSSGYGSGSSGGYGTGQTMVWSPIQGKMIPKSEADAEKRITDSRVNPVTSGSKTTIQPFDPMAEEDGDDVAFSTVRALCAELQKLSPEQIGEDYDMTKPSTPYYVFDLWTTAEINYDRPLTLSELIGVLYDLVNDKLTTAAAAIEYTDVITELEEERNALREEQGIAELVGEDPKEQDGFDTILDGIHEMLEGSAEDTPAILGAPEAD